MATPWAELKAVRQRHRTRAPSDTYTDRMVCQKGRVLAGFPGDDADREERAGLVVKRLTVGLDEPIQGGPVLPVADTGPYDDDVEWRQIGNLVAADIEQHHGTIQSLENLLHTAADLQCMAVDGRVGDECPRHQDVRRVLT